jgi:hypothetical protein
MGYKEDIVRLAEDWDAEINTDIQNAVVRLVDAQNELKAAQQELDGLRGLLLLMKGAAEQPPDANPRLTLHEAMVQVLEKAPKQMMRAADLTSEINRLQLYRMRDGRPVEAQQIHARVGNYPEYFKKVGTFITLTDEHGN